MTSLPITSILVAIACVALVALSFPVTLRRFKVRAATGHGGDESLKRLVRAQGNFIEYTPIALIGIGLVEMGGASAVTVWFLGGCLMLGRLLHAVGMYRMTTNIRAPGIILTYVSLLGSALILAKNALG